MLLRRIKNRVLLILKQKENDKVQALKTSAVIMTQQLLMYAYSVLYFKMAYLGLNV